MKLGKTIEEIEIGESGSFSKTVTETDITLFAAITGDFNPMHMNEELAKNTMFKTRIAHGGIAASLIAPVLGTILPGLGTVALSQSTRFKAPVFPGDTVTATATVTEKDIEKNKVEMECVWTNQDGTVVAKGESSVMPPRKEYAEMLGVEK